MSCYVAADQECFRGFLQEMQSLADHIQSVTQDGLAQLEEPRAAQVLQRVVSDPAALHRAQQRLPTMMSHEWEKQLLAVVQPYGPAVQQCFQRTFTQILECSDPSGVPISVTVRQLLRRIRSKSPPMDLPSDEPWVIAGTMQDVGVAIRRLSVAVDTQLALADGQLPVPLEERSGEPWLHGVSTLLRQLPEGAAARVRTLEPPLPSGRSYPHSVVNVLFRTGTLRALAGCDEIHPEGRRRRQRAEDAEEEKEEGRQTKKGPRGEVEYHQREPNVITTNRGESAAERSDNASASSSASSSAAAQCAAGPSLVRMDPTPTRQELRPASPLGVSPRSQPPQQQQHAVAARAPLRHRRGKTAASPPIPSFRTHSAGEAVPFPARPRRPPATTDEPVERAIVSRPTDVAQAALLGPEPLLVDMADPTARLTVLLADLRAGRRWCDSAIVSARVEARELLDRLRELSSVMSDVVTAGGIASVESSLASYEVVFAQWALKVLKVAACVYVMGPIQQRLPPPGG